MNSELYSALRAIQSCDPDGGETEPTEAAYAVHKAWAIARFGPEVWKIYNSRWETVAEV